MRKVSKHLQLFLRNRGICQLTDHAYDMCMSIFCNYSVTVLLNKWLRCIVKHGTPVHAVVMAMGLLYRLYIMIKHGYYTGLWIHWFRDHDATIHNGTVTIGRTLLVSVGHSGSDPIVPLMLRTICFRAMVRTLALYYRSLGTASTLLRKGKISGRPYMGVMTYNALVFYALKQLGNFYRFYTIIFKSFKTS